MKKLALGYLAASAGCVPSTDPVWQLNHDRLVAVRATPPHVVAGEIAALDALVSHKGAPTDVEQPLGAIAAPGTPDALGGLVQLDAGMWDVHGTDDATLVGVRAIYGLPDGAPVPLDVVMQFPASNGIMLDAKKTVWLGDSQANPSDVGNVTLAGVPLTPPLVVPIGVDIPLATDTDPANGVQWLSSCGTLHDSDEHAAVLHVQPKDPLQGELALVVRDPLGGVAWQVWPISAK